MHKRPLSLNVPHLHQFRSLSSPLVTRHRILANRQSTSSSKPSAKLPTLISITTTPHSSSPRPLQHPQAPLHRAIASDKPPRTSMASDEDYMSFLDKANQDLDDGRALAAKQKDQDKAAFKTMDSGTQAPKVIKDACKDAVYVTDADEPFEEVSLKWSGDGLPDETEFAKLIKHWDADNADINIMDPVDWDSQGQYTKLIEAVREATKGNDVRVYSVARDKTRTEYWLVSSEEGRIVGVKALGVES